MADYAQGGYHDGGGGGAHGKTQYPDGKWFDGTNSPSGVVPPARYWTDTYKSAQRKAVRAKNKDSDRTLEYFANVERALLAIAAQQRQHAEEVELAAAAQPIVDDEDDTEGAAAPPQPAPSPFSTSDVLDGFCTEVAKRVTKDGTALLGSRVVCRVIELALSTAEARHVQALTYALLGKVVELAASPTASFMLETLMASTYHVVGKELDAAAAVGADPASLATATGRGGIPALPKLFGMFFEELLEAAADLLWHKSGAKTLAAAILVASGVPVRGVPANPHFVRPDLVGKAASVLVPMLQEAVPDHDHGLVADACVHVSASFVVQALVHAAARVDLPGLGAPLRAMLDPIVADLLVDGVGSRVVECYAANGGDAAWNLVFDQAASSLERAAGSYVPRFAVLSLVDGAQSEDTLVQVWDRLVAPFLTSHWMQADGGTEAAPEAADAAAEAKKQAVARGNDPLLRFCERLVPSSDGEKAAPVAVSSEFRKRVVNDVSKACREAHTKGPAHALLVARAGGAHGAHLAGVLLRFGTSVCATLAHSFDKVRVDELPTVAKTPEGSVALQRYIDFLAAAAASTVAAKAAPAAPAPQPAKPAPPTGPKSGAELRLARKRGGVAPLPKPAAPVKPAAPALPQGPMSPLLKFAKRLEPALCDLVTNKYSSFVVQHLYAQGDTVVRELICQALANKFQDLKNDFVASKVLVACSVEQFLYRNDEWKGQAARQAHIKRVMAVVLAAEAQHESKEAKAALGDKRRRDGDRVTNE